MKKTTIIFAICFLFAVLVFLPSTYVKAEDLTGTKEDAIWRIHAAYNDYHFLDKDYDIDSFRPGDKITYGQFAQWLYYHENRNQVSQKKAIAWLRAVFYDVALKHPEFAYEFLEGFTDGKFEKFSYKKQASWKWIDTVLYVLVFYQDGRKAHLILEKIGFDFDVTVVDYALFGVDKNGERIMLSDLAHERWIRSYSKKNSTKPNRIEAVEALYTVYSFYLIE